MASLNRRPFRLPSGACPDPALEGLTAHAVLSRDALARSIAARAGALGPGAAGGPAAPPALNRALGAPQAGVRAAAAEVAAGFGRNLGYLLAALHPGNALSADPWERAYLAHWAERIETVVLGGGLASGLLGEAVAREAQAAARSAGRRLAVRAAPAPGALPLLGAARMASPAPAGNGGGGSAVVVADFGTSGAKSGVARLDAAGALRGLEARPVVPFAALTDGAHPEALAAAVVAVLAATYRAAARAAGAARGGRVDPHVVCSVAAYALDGGLPADVPGAYPGLRQVADTEDVAGWLAGRVGAAVGAPLGLRFVHDGTAAGAACAGTAAPGRTAVVTLGTGLGVGFVPPATGHRALAPGFRVDVPAA
jgi:hypothetical protein